MHGVHDFDGAGAAFGLGETGVNLQHLRDLVADLRDRVQRRHRLLKDHRHLGAAKVAEAGFGGLEGVFALKQRLAAGGLQFLRQKAHHRLRGDGFTRPAFAHHADDFAGGDGEADVLNRVLAVAAVRQADGQVADFEDVSGHGALTSAWRNAGRAYRAARRPAC